MIRVVAWLDRHAGLVLVVAMVGLALVCLLLSGCGEAPPAPRQEQPEQASPTPRPDLPAAPTTTAVIDRRIADLQGQLAQAREDRAAAQRQAQEAELAAWRRWARWIAGLGLPLCAAAAALGAWFGLARIAVPIAGAAAVACVALVAYAEALGWAAWLVPGLGLLALLAVAVVLLRRRDGALVATARLADAIEGRVVVATDKLQARAAQELAGVHRLVQSARGRP
jgi:hypothetical protein